MSKSKGNILTVSVLQEKGYDPLVYRMFCLQSHYRKPLEFSYDTLDNSKLLTKGCSTALRAYLKRAKRMRHSLKITAAALSKKWATI